MRPLPNRCGRHLVKPVPLVQRPVFKPDVSSLPVSDLVMPKVDGLELLKRIKMQDSQVRFLMITGYPNIDSAINAIKEGADDYVNKPFHMEDIRIKVDRLIDFDAHLI